MWTLISGNCFVRSIDASPAGPTSVYARPSTAPRVWAAAGPDATANTVMRTTSRPMGTPLSRRRSSPDGSEFALAFRSAGHAAQRVVQLRRQGLQVEPADVLVRDAPVPID